MMKRLLLLSTQTQKMGRKRKPLKWWQQCIQQEAPKPASQIPAGRFLLKDEVIQAGDHFLSAGQFYSVSSTIGLPWHDKLPPMWRGPLASAKPPQQEHVIISTKHQEFLDLVEMAGFILPNQFKHWRRFFLDEKNFLAEAEHWLSLRLQGRYPKIEDDVDKGLMTKGASDMPASHPRVYQPSYSRDDDDYWTSWQGWGGGNSQSAWANRWAEPALPLTPKLPAPSGTCGMELVVL